MRLASHAPRHCSSCYWQRTERRHVDFEVAYDGPVLNAGDIPYSIDDLIVCEKCLADAAKLIGLTRQEELEEKLAQVTAERDAAVDQAAQVKAYADSLEQAVALKPVVLAEGAPKAAPEEEPKPTTRQRRTKTKEEKG